MSAPPPVDLPRLQQSFGRRELAPLRRRIADRIRLGQALDRPTTLRGLTADERSATERLLGKTPRPGDPARPLTVHLGQLADQLRDAGIAPDLRAALESIDGPVANEAADRRVQANAWQTLFDRRTDGLPWLAHPKARGLTKRLAAGSPDRAGELLAQTTAVLAALPNPGTTRPVLAAEILGNAHALDPGRPVATLVTRALRQLHPDADDDHERWETQGVYRNDLTRTALCLNLSSTGNTWLAELLRLHARTGEPARLTLRQLHGVTPAVFGHPGDVYACENPAVLGVAAARLGPAGKPLICVSGRPGSAVHRLLSLLTQAGAALHYHGDFDAAGLAIAQTIIERHHARPWRFGQCDYEQAITARRGFSRRTDVPAPATPWAPALQPAIEHAKQDVHEEAVLDTLLEDLKR